MRRTVGLYRYKETNKIAHERACVRPPLGVTVGWAGGIPGRFSRENHWEGSLGYLEGSLGISLGGKTLGDPSGILEWDLWGDP